MWKVELICDPCRSTCVIRTSRVEVLDVRSRAAINIAKQQAREAGWVFVPKVGWICGLCANARPRDNLAKHARYIGTIETADGVKLKGMRVLIVSRMVETNTVQALFEDPTAGRWHKHTHWFWEHEFEYEAEGDPGDDDAKLQQWEDESAAIARE